MHVLKFDVESDFSDFLNERCEASVSSSTRSDNHLCRVFDNYVHGCWHPSYIVVPEAYYPLDIFSSFPWTVVRNINEVSIRYRNWKEIVKNIHLKSGSSLADKLKVIKPHKLISDIHHIYGLHLPSFCEKNIVFVLLDNIDLNHLKSRYCNQFRYN